MLTSLQCWLRASPQVFTDYTCPFCARMWKRLVSEVRELSCGGDRVPPSHCWCSWTQVIPWMNATFPKQISLVVYTMPQPWHPQGTIRTWRPK